MERATILMYHNVGVPERDTRMRGLYVTPRMFRFQMRYLKTAGFKVVSLKELEEYLSGGHKGEKLVVITFDDGYEDFYFNAHPILKKFGYPSTVFLVSDLIGKENIWDEGKSISRKKLMNQTQIETLIKDNVTFGAHSRTHPYLTKVNDEDLQDEVKESKRILEQMFQAGFDSFCYPYGDHDERVVNAVKEANYRAAVSVHRGFVYPGDNLFTLKRVSIKRNTHPLSFIYKLHSDYEIRKNPMK